MKKFDTGLYFITDSTGFGEEEFLQRVECALQGGVSLMQLREKVGSTWEYIELAEKVHALAKQYSVPLIIDDRLDVAMAIDAEGVHLGQVNSYRIDSNWQYLDDDNDPSGIGTALGVGICKSSYWGNGYGSHALAAFACYLLEQGEKNLFLQTWSGNIRMVRAAQKLGFLECNRFLGNRLIRGNVYDGLTFKLDLERFHEYLAENP